MAARSRCYCWSRYRRSLRNRPHRRPDNSPSSSKFPTRSFPPRPASLSRRWLPVRPLRLEHRSRPRALEFPAARLGRWAPRVRSLRPGPLRLADRSARWRLPALGCRCWCKQQEPELRVKRGPGARDTSSDVGVSRYADRSSFFKSRKGGAAHCLPLPLLRSGFAFSAHGPAADAATLASRSPPTAPESAGARARTQ